MNTTAEALERILATPYKQTTGLRYRLIPVENLQDIARAALPQARLEAAVIEAARKVEYDLRVRGDHGVTFLLENELRDAVNALVEPPSGEDTDG